MATWHYTVEGAEITPRPRTLTLRDGLDAALEQINEDTEINRLRTVCFVLELDDSTELADRHGQSAADALIQRTGDRIVSALRDGAVVARLEDHRFGICLQPVRHLDMELCIQMAGRIQSAIEEPIAVAGLTIYLSYSIGFCPLSRAP